MRRFLKYSFYIGLILSIVGAAAGATVGFYFYIRLTRDLPQIDRVSDYHPKAVTSFYADDGRTLIGEVFEEWRYPVKLEEVPRIVQQAFLAAEDAKFYEHPGVSITSILRAMWVNFRKKTIKQGASTITQQVVKALLLDRAKKWERKAKEAILSYRLEKALTKNEIFNIYLNEIFLGNTAYGVKAAARVHFRKELNQLSIAEAAFLAALPKQPSYYMQPQHRDEALDRQHYVLNQMLEHGMITREQKDAAEKTKLVFYLPETKKLPGAEYYLDHAVHTLEEKLSAIDRKLSPANPGGYEVRTAINVQAQQLAVRSVQRGLREVDKRRGWRGPLKIGDKTDEISIADTQEVADTGVVAGTVYSAVVKEIHKESSSLEVQVGNFTGTVDLKKATWAQRMIDKDDHVTGIDLYKYIKPGHVIEVSLDSDKAAQAKVITDQKQKLPLLLDQTPDLEGAFVLQNVLSGEAKAIVGGYDYRRSEFNRATQGTRQPGSSFKPFIYLAALDNLKFTPSTIVPDSPISLVAGNGKMWTPGNFDGKYLGPITLRTALQRSRNVVSVYMATKLGLDKIIDSARNLGITTPIGHDLSISLGSSEVKLIEMVHAYGTFAAGGLLADQIIIKTVRDREGRVIVDARPHATQKISEESAFIMAHMMKGVVERGTATIVNKLGKPVAGKTGTTNDEMDAWFIGYTPEWSAGAWVGFDKKKMIGSKETGGKVSAPIFLYFMQEFLKDTPALDFVIPDGVVPVLVNIGTGRPTSREDPGAFVEYFKSGTEPSAKAGEEEIKEIPKEYLEGDEF